MNGTIGPKVAGQARRSKTIFRMAAMRDQPATSAMPLVPAGSACDRRPNLSRHQGVTPSAIEANSVRRGFVKADLTA